VSRVPRRADGGPAAFLSYAHFDDQHDGGLITAFRKRLEGELRAQTAREVQIFQDQADIVLGTTGRIGSTGPSMPSSS
jgi:F-box protein 11